MQPQWRRTRSHCEAAARSIVIVTGFPSGPATVTDISQIRREFASRPLRRADLDPDPVRQFRQWMDEAIAAAMADPNAMSLATVGPDGQPSLRTVLLKGLDERGFVFYTNLGSRKAAEIGASPCVALLFYWPELSRQVKVTGEAARTGVAEDLRYFASRPRDSQLGAWASAQSRPVAGRALLEQAFEQMRRRYADGEVPLPAFWGGYRVRPSSIEFWQARANRLHDRFVYTRGDGGWTIERLAP